MSYPILCLKFGKEGNVIHKHPWIFSGALEKTEEKVSHGALVYVADTKGKILGTGTYSAFSNIAVRIFDFTETIIDTAWFIKYLKNADMRRRLLGYGHNTTTTAYRLIFAESDGIPGLIVDRYADVFVMQISTAGMDLLKDALTQALISLYKPRCVIEKSDLEVRREESLEKKEEILFGNITDVVQFSEYGNVFYADILQGQKTGFFLDQKDLRAEIQKLSNGRNVLNLFSYSGSAGITAMKGGAVNVHNVDSSKAALELCKKHAILHDISSDAFTTEESDIFQWLAAQRESKYDMIILDPPAIIKSNRDLESGKKAYHFINRAAMRLLKENGIYVTSSCSHFFTEEDFIFMLRRASIQTGKHFDILKTLTQSPDHPLSLYFPESRYLKSFILKSVSF